MSKVFAVKRTCIVREGFALDSERRGVLQKGQDVEALELRENEEGATRVRIERGWVSLCTPSGRGSRLRWYTPPTTRNSRP